MKTYEERLKTWLLNINIPETLKELLTKAYFEGRSSVYEEMEDRLKIIQDLRKLEKSKGGVNV